MIQCDKMLNYNLAYLVPSVLRRHLSLLDTVQVRHEDVKGVFLSINTSAVLGILMPPTVVLVGLPLFVRTPIANQPKIVESQA